MGDPRRLLLTLAACIGDAAGLQVGAACTIAEVDPDDWLAVITLADRFLVTAALWPPIRRRGLGSRVPAEARAYLRDVHRQNGVRNGLLRQQLLEAVTVLNDREIVPVVLKGACWLLATPQRSSSRIMADLDLLVAHEAVAPSIAALATLGYRPVPDDPGVRQHAVTLARPGSLVTIDLHHDVGPVGGIITSAEVMVGAGPIDADVAVRAPTATHRALASLIGSEIAGPNYHLGVLALRPLQDLAACAAPGEAALDWLEIRSRLRPVGLAHRADAWARAAAWLFGLEVPAAMRTSLRARLHLGRCMAQLRWPSLSPLARLANSLAHPFEPTRLAYLYPEDGMPRALRHLRRITSRHGLGLAGKLGAQGEMP
jgi:hypothetical protein